MIILLLLAMAMFASEEQKPPQFIHKLSNQDKSIIIIPSTHEEKSKILQAKYTKLLKDADILFVEENFMNIPSRSTNVAFEVSLISEMKKQGKPIDSLQNLDSLMMSLFAPETIIAQTSTVGEMYQQCNQELFRFELIDLAFVTNHGTIAKKWCDLCIRFTDGVNEEQTDAYMRKSQEVWVAKLLHTSHKQIVAFVGWNHVYDERFSIVPKLLESGMTMDFFFGRTYRHHKKAKLYLI